ncbi:hypothetical protein [Kitasatospora sp. HPMI-4]|uniref:hypothetical protein n=1 Tax=Kitasatospora sp. HPMI-4 TaxID=3448443 RepID=UPI003F1B5C07
MNPYRVLAAAAADWERLSRLLTEEAARQLAAALAALRSSAQDDPGRPDLAAQAARLLLDSLPGPEAAELGGGTGARFDPAGQEHSYLGFGPDDLAVLVLDGHRMVGPVLGSVRRRLLAQPALDEPELRLLGGDPATPGLLRLRGPGGVERIPGFQFGAAGRPRTAVLEVNLILGAEQDPWAVADWWLSANAWLGGSPAELLGTGREGQVVDAARYLAEGE